MTSITNESDAQMEKQVYVKSYRHVLWQSPQDTANQAPAVEQRDQPADRSPEATPITPAVGYWTDGEPTLSTADNVAPPHTQAPEPENTSALTHKGTRPPTPQPHDTITDEHVPTSPTPAQRSILIDDNAATPPQPAEPATLPPYDSTILTRRLPRESAGNDKDYYHTPGDPVGFMGVKPGCSTQVLDRELAAKRAILTSSPSLAPYFGASIRARHTIYGEGLLVRHLDFRIGPNNTAVEFKPKLLGSAVGAEKLNKIFNIITDAQLPLPIVRNELQHIADNLNVISAAVGELTLVITAGQEGSFAKMLDLAPNDKNQRMDMDSSKRAHKGLSELIKKLDTEISAKKLEAEPRREGNKAICKPKSPHQKRLP
ncbi:hypothetical protein [Aeromonas hydrophila]|uniref:hypothetical protein n=1 Tax=Aeromonas hydrophila TaxID=644 RepID=UPI0038D252C7